MLLEPLRTVRATDGSWDPEPGSGYVDLAEVAGIGDLETDSLGSHRFADIHMRGSGRHVVIMVCDDARISNDAALRWHTDLLARWRRALSER